METKKSIVALSVLSILTACGGGSSSNNNTPTPTPTPTPTAVETAVSGKAANLANAKLTAYKYVDNAPVALTSDEIKETDIITDAEGNYSFTVIDFEGPLKVELSVGESTTLLCGSIAKCGDIDFGSTIDLSTSEPDLTFASIVNIPTISDTAVTINTSTLTHLASKLIESKMMTSDSDKATIIQEQSSIIANAFNINGVLSDLSPTPVTHNEMVVAEDNIVELKYGLIEAGIHSALFNTNATAMSALFGPSGQTNSNDITEKLSQAIDDLVEYEGSFILEQDDDSDFELSLVEVLSGASDSAKHSSESIAADTDLTGTESIIESLNQLETNLENQSVFEMATANDDGRSGSSSTIITDGDAVAKAKSMVQDVRLFANLFDPTKDQNVVSQGDAYLALVDDAGAMVEEEAASFLLLANIADVLGEIASGMTDGNGTVDAADYIDGATGSISFNEQTDNGGMSFALSVMKGEETVMLNADAAFTDEGMSITLSLDGKIESANAILSLTEGSYAKINLDQATSREALDQDMDSPDVVSGSLDLTMSLAQKQTDTVTNPVTFEGMIKTDLVAVKTNTLNPYEQYLLDEFGRAATDEFGFEILKTYYRKGKGSDILPEMLTLSGAIGTHEGDLVKATLTVDIQDLDSYEAPEFEYIGAPFENMVSVSVSGDKNTVEWTLNDDLNTNLSQSVAGSTIFEPGATQGEWSYTLTTTSKYGNSSSDKFQRRVIPNGNLTNYAYTIESTSYVFYELVTAFDSDNDGIADSYSHSYFLGASLDDDGNLLDWEGNIIELTEANAGDTYYYDDLDTLLERHALQPDSVTNGAENFAYMAKYFIGTQNFTLASGESVTFNADENTDKLTSIGQGNSAVLQGNYTADIFMEDAIKIVANDTGDTITKTVANEFDIVHTYQFVEPGVTNYSYTLGEYQTTISTTAEDVGLDYAEVLYKHQTYSGSAEYKIIPQDTSSTPDGIADEFGLKYVYGEYFNEDGVLVDWNGDLLNVEEHGFVYITKPTVDDLVERTTFLIPVSPYTDHNAVDYFKSDISGSVFGYGVTNVGTIEIDFTKVNLDVITAGSTSYFDAVNTMPEELELLENEDVFLDVNAALSLEVVLGEYEINLAISGKRTGLEDGEFDLDLSYSLPGETSQRALSVYANTKEADTIVAENAENVVLLLTELEDNAESNVIGLIYVEGVQAAQVEDRDGIITIVYSDETVESL